MRALSFVIGVAPLLFATGAALAESGKSGAHGKSMQVWHDYVAGTDPTNPGDVFTASIAFGADGIPVVGHLPVLSAAEAARRKYTTYGKVKLDDADWTPVPSGDEANYNFFNVTVEMR